MLDNPSVLDWLFDASQVRVGDSGPVLRRGPTRVRNGREYAPLYERVDDGNGPRWFVRCTVPTDQLVLCVVDV